MEEEIEAAKDKNVSKERNAYIRLVRRMRNREQCSGNISENSLNYIDG